MYIVVSVAYAQTQGRKSSFLFLGQFTLNPSTSKSHTKFHIPQRFSQSLPVFISHSAWLKNSGHMYPLSMLYMMIVLYNAS